MAKSTDKQVATVIDKLAASRERLEKSLRARPQWKTNCRLEMPGWKAINIPVEGRLDLISYAVTQLTALKTAMTRMKLSPMWDGYKIADWIGDLKQRIAKLKEAEELAKVNCLERRATPLLTESQKRERDFAALLGDLGDLGL